MRHRPRTGLALSVLVLPLVLVAPVVTLPGSGPAPVPTSLSTVALPTPTTTSGGLRTALRGATATLPARDTKDFSTLGVTWKASAEHPDVEVFVKTRTRGQWTDWVDLEGESDDTADVGGADTARSALREGTRPVYVGPSDAVAVKVQVLSGAAPSDLRVDLVDPGTSPADTARRPASVAGASEPQPFIVSRAEWGADESMKTCVAGYTGTPRVAFVHHTASTNDYSPSEAPAAVRGFYAYHVKSNGWCDIGYNFLVDRYGVLYEGRFGGIEKAVLGAHTGGFNTNSFGTAMIGSFTSVTPPQALRTSLAKLIAWKLGRSYADPGGTARLTAQGSGSRFAAGTTHTFSVVSGHRDAVDTTCPGDLGYATLGQLRSDVRAEMGASFVAPSASPLTTTTTPVAVSSGLLQPLDWRLEVTSASTGEVVRSLTGRADTRVETSWDLRDGAGVPVLPGSYRATLYGGPEDAPALPYSATVTVQAPPTSSPSPSATPSAAPAPGSPAPS
ncbi:MAG: N-acetylmuramoyl-L-alanine amidase, family 2, partial [Frankiales bacterium]|nr:N-acetylmuramoyl-L-alanine amidase, family 2 [Frankiales bacterium]